MRKKYLNFKFEDFKSQFDQHTVHRKKVRALEHYMEAVSFAGSKYISFFLMLLRHGFLDEQESNFLDYQIRKVEICPYTWSHKIPWVKKEIRRIQFREAAKPSKQIYFDFYKPREAVTVPLELLTTKNTNRRAAIR